ncbi:MAG: AAA family ATPase [Candidatus Microsaccharimonas sp.]
MTPVEKVTDFTLKSFTGYTGPSCLFGRSNIFFAPNGNGKSSLALGLRTEYLKTHDEANLRIYNKHFVSEQLLLQDGGGIKGVKADFGKVDVDLEKRIQEQSDLNDEAQAQIDTLTEKNEKLVAATTTTLDDIFKRRKGKASIAKKPIKEGIHEKVVQLWTDDYTNAVKQFPDEKYDEIDGEKDFKSTLDLINGLSLSRSPEIAEADFEELGRITAKTYSTIEIPSADIVSWLETGLELHSGKDHCEYCKSPLDTKEVAQRIQAYLDDERSVDRKILEKIQNSLRLIYKNINDITDASETVTVTLEQDESVKQSLVDLATSKQAIEDAGKVIADKIEAMSEKVSIDVDSLKNTLDTAQEHIQALLDVREKLKSLYEDKINRLEILVKGAIGFEVKNSQLVSDNTAVYAENNKKIAELKKDIRTRTEAIRKLRDSKSDLSDFAEYLNQIFEEIGIGFKLVLSGKAYALQHSILNVDLNIDDISEGERNLLALVYFYYEMLGSDKKNLKDNLEIVIIDDPATSMDDENRFFILELVKSIIDNRNFQSFVLTHSWRDYCDLCYGKYEEANVKKFEITKVSGQSDIELSRSITMPYRKLYKEIYEFSQKSADQLTPDEALHMPNTMRRVLEEYIRFNFGIALATQSSYNEIAVALFETDVINISANNEAKLKKLLSVCNVLSHGTPPTRSITEIHTSSRFLMNRIKDINTYHHNEMKQ